MAELLRMTPHLTAAPFDEAFKGTYLGQAHIAGSGPPGRTCRECRFFHLLKDGAPVSPGFYSKANRDTAGQLKPAKCNYPIPHKAPRRFPHHAKACRFFEAAEKPFPASAPASVQ